MCANNHVQRIDAAHIVDSATAVHQFESFGGRLTIFSGFGEDPLRQHAALVTQREREFRRCYPDFGVFFYIVVNSDYSLFRQGLLYFIDLSKQLQCSIV